MLFTQKNWIDIFNSITDGIYITDGEGNTLWLNDASEKNLGRPRSDFIGKNSIFLEEQGVFTPSVVRMALKKNKNVSIVQSIDTGRKYLVSGHLIFDQKGKIEFIVIQSRDITHAMKINQQLDEMEALLNRYTEEIRLLTTERNLEKIRESFVFKSQSYQDILELTEQIARVDTGILITGETGVGKNVIAKRIHYASNRSEQPFIEVNCGAIPESLMESELFGYKKGAFTGASSSGKTGLIERANKGTLFLDEIGDLPLHLQSKLLHFLQSKNYRSIGDTNIKKADVRIIAATNSNLMKMVVEGKFRADLYYRLSIIPVEIPPLRDRQEDIAPLIHFFLEKFNKKYGTQVILTSEVMKLLRAYHWPGNIRELENLLERLVVTAKNKKIKVNQLPDYIKTLGRSDSWKNKQENETLPQLLERIERTHIEQALKKYKTTRKAAQKLGVNQSYIMRRLKKYKEGLSVENE